MREIQCLSCKYGRTRISFRETIGNITRFKRECISCGAELATYIVDEGKVPVGNMKPLPPAPQFDAVGMTVNEYNKIVPNDK
jgi:hypothetical protein